MGDKHSHFPLYERSPVYQLIISLLIVISVGSLFFSGLLLAGTYIFDTNLRLPGNPSTITGENEIAFLKYMLISQSISIFIVPAILILKRLKPADQTGYSDLKIPGINEIFLVVLLSFCIFPITSLTGQINSGMKLPDWLSGLERWMVDKEDNVSGIMDLILVPGSFWTMMLNVFMIAVIPAIGEELIFRGVFQKILCRLFSSGYMAVWLTAFVFSAIHLQFFGFLPRFILGLVFGYLFLWSGNLWLPIIAHFVNNAVPTIGAGIQHLESISSTQDFTILKQIAFLPLPVLISLTILLYFRNKGIEKLS